MRRRALTAAVVLSVAAVSPLAADDHAPSAADHARAEVAQVAESAGLEAEDLLSLEIPLRAEDGTPLPATVEELIAALAERPLVDPGYSGIHDTPELAAGNLLHTFVAVAAYVAPRTHQPDLDAYRYRVSEAPLSPDTPLVPVVNPLIAAGNPGGLPPVLGFHAGGKLKSVQAAGYTAGYHSAGTTPIGSSLDTRERTPGSGDTVPAPVYVPLAHPGELALADTAIDFVGFAQVVTGAQCTKTNIPFTSNAFFVCAGGGVLLADGAANFDGGPVNLRDDLPALWDAPPA